MIDRSFQHVATENGHAERRSASVEIGKSAFEITRSFRATSSDGISKSVAADLRLAGEKIRTDSRINDGQSDSVLHRFMIERDLFIPDGM